MPRKPKRISDFDRKLGAVIEHRRLDPDHAMTQKELSEATDIPLSNLQRREAGINEVTVSELERIAYHLGTTPAEMVKDALRRYGGIEKLIAEYAPKSEALPKLDDYRKPDLATMPEEELTRGKHAAGKDDELEQPEDYS